MIDLHYWEALLQSPTLLLVVAVLYMARELRAQKKAHEEARAEWLKQLTKLTVVIESLRDYLREKR